MTSTTTPDTITATDGGDLQDTNNQENNEGDGHENGPPSEEGPLQTAEQVLQCQFSTWYPTFSNVPAAAAAVDAAVDAAVKAKVSASV